MATATNELTDRQQEVVALQKEGKTPPEIAKALGLSDNAVYQALRRIRERTNGASATTTRRRSGSRSRGTSRRTTRRRTTRPRTLLPAEEPSMTPLQAIRGRRTIIERELATATTAETEARKALDRASETKTKLAAKHEAELAVLGKAEALITGKSAAKKRPARKSTKSRRRKSAGTSAGSGGAKAA